MNLVFYYVLFIISLESESRVRTYFKEIMQNKNFNLKSNIKQLGLRAFHSTVVLTK